MSRHTDFILSPITEILKEVASANAGIGNGIETYPLTEYILQSVFLKMTGFQEQKMKCICWELATDDYEYRYDFTRTPMGEFSNYKDKNKVYQDLVGQINKHTTFNVATDLDKADILTTTISEIKNIFLDTNLFIWTQESFSEYESIINVYQDNHFANTNKDLFTETAAPIYSLKKIFVNYLYKQRNRCAHNTQSYQENLPTLKTLLDRNYQFHNYFIWFAILILLDKIYVELYRKYMEVLDEN